MSKRLRIAVNTRFLIKNRLEGIGLFTYESLKRITQSHPEIDFCFLFDRNSDQEFVFSSNVTPVHLFPPARHPFLWFLWFEFSVAQWLNKNQPALFLSCDGYGCLRSKIPQVLVMHDLAFEHFPHHVPALVQAYFKHFMPKYAINAARIATVSQYSKDDIAQRYQISPQKIDVVYNGAKEVYRPVTEFTRQQIQKKYSSGKNYFICVSSIHPRKNIANLLLSFEQFKSATASDFKLIIVGRKAWSFSEVEKTHESMSYKEDVSFLGHIPSTELGDIVASAFAMVYVSLFEGFGIPIIEALNCRIPVITSNVTSMPEAAGDAALLVNPHSVEDISNAMKRLVQDIRLRNSLVEKSTVQAKKFSWDSTAERLWSCCSKILNNG